jgi:hypothetical protein
MRTAELDIDTTGRQLVDLTDDIVEFCDGAGITTARSGTAPTT